MLTLYKIVEAAGITDPAIGDHIMRQKTPAAQSVMLLLRDQVAHYDESRFNLLKAAVEECRLELVAAAPTAAA
jgi:hypothetical protein